LSYQLCCAFVRAVGNTLNAATFQVEVDAPAIGANLIRIADLEILHVFANLSGNGMDFDVVI